MAQVPVSELRELVVARLRQQFPQEDAELMADVVVFGDMAGRSSHGISRVLPGSFGPMDEQPGPPPSVERTGTAAATVSGRPGMLLVVIATELLIELAGASGFGLVTTRGSRSTSGSLTYYMEKLTGAGLFGLICANTIPIVTAPGSADRLFGTNPITFGIPADGYPFILDMATSAITGGEVLAAMADGSSLPSGVAVDSSGALATDPGRVWDGGALLPFGGHKGLGLAMMIEILNRSVAGAKTGDDGALEDWGHVLLAFSLDSVGDPGEIRQLVQAELNRIRAAQTADGSGVRIPGHRSLQRRDEAEQRGWVEVDDDAYRRLSELVEATS